MFKVYLQKYRKLPIQVKASVWFLICSFLQKGVSTVTTPIFTRLLSTAEYGQYSVFNSWLSIVTIFVSLNLYSGVYTTGLIKFSDEREEYSSTLQGLTLVLCVCWTFVYFLFHNFWNKLFSLTTVQMLAMLIMIWATAAFSFWSAEQRVKYQYKQLVAVTLLVSIAKPIVGIIFVITADDKVTARILGLALVEFIGYVGLFIVQVKRGKRLYSKKYWKHAILFNIPLIPHYLSQTVLNSADRIMINNMVGNTEAGIYSLAYSISQIMLLFNTALSQTMSPWIYQKIKDKKTQDIAGIAYIAIAIISLVNLALIAIAPEAVGIFAPSSYHDAIWVIPPVALSVVFMFSYDLFAKFEFYYEKTKLVMTASVVGAVLNIVLNYIFIHMFGYYAAAYTTLVCYIVYDLAHYHFMVKVCNTYNDGIKPYNPQILISIYVGVIAVGFFLMTTYNYPVLRYVIIAIALGIVVLKRNNVLQIVKKIVALKKKG